MITLNCQSLSSSFGLKMNLSLNYSSLDHLNYPMKNYLGHFSKSLTNLVMAVERRVRAALTLVESASVTAAA